MFIIWHESSKPGPSYLMHCYLYLVNQVSHFEFLYAFIIPIFDCLN